MATRTPNASAVDEQSRVERATRIAGLGDAFGEAFDLGPPVLALQQGLLAGLLRAQAREAERLARRNPDDARIAEARTRAAQFAQIGSALRADIEAAGRALQTLQQDGLFHGYVLQADGAPATGCTVRLTLRDANGGKPLLTASDTTDPAGYFRIDFGGGTRAPAGMAGSVRRWADRLASAFPLEDRYPAAQRTTPANTTGADTTTTGTGANRTDAPASSVPKGAQAAVEVLDAAGRSLLEDATPPDFDALGSAFRYYVLP